jgi:large subunit ribosomal protein L6
MSKIAKRIIAVPENVKVYLNSEYIYVEGPLGKSNKLEILKELEIINENQTILTNSIKNPAIAGTYNSLLTNAIKGVTEGFKDFAEVRGVGYKVNLKDGKLELLVGKSHPVYVEIPSDLKVTVKGNRIDVEGVDKQVVGNFIANKIAKHRLPNVYKKDKGIYRSGIDTPIKIVKSLNK